MAPSLRWHANTMGNCQNSSFSAIRPGGKAARVGGLWIFVAQHLARSAMDEVKPGVRRTIDALVLVFGRIIAILQPVLDPLVGGSGGAMNFDKRSFGLALLWFAAVAVATVVLYAVVHH